MIPGPTKTMGQISRRYLRNMYSSEGMPKNLYHRCERKREGTREIEIITLLGPHEYIWDILKQNGILLLRHHL